MKRFCPSGPSADCMATIYDYGGGLVEGSWHSIRDVVRQQPQEKAKRGESANREQNEFFAIRRARTKVRRLVLTLRPTSLGTTTFRENVTDPKAAWRAMDKFVRFVHRRYPHDKFIAVPELQKRGALHFHFPISGWMPKEKLRYYHDCWRKATRKYGGTFNISWHRRHGVSDSENSVRICNYLSKYMSKQLGQTPRELGKHRYRASKDIQPPRVKYLMDAQTLDKAAEELVSLIELHGGIAKYYFQGSLDSGSPAFGWACTWGRGRLQLPTPPPSG